MRENYFQLFKIHEEFKINLNDLKQSYSKLVLDYHPDKVLISDIATKRLYTEKITYINQAYQTLKQPSKRALYLISLLGDEVALEKTINDSTFLLQQIELRDELDDIRSIDDIEIFKNKVKLLLADLEDDFAGVPLTKKSVDQLDLIARRMQFVEKLLKDINDFEDKIEN